MHSMIAIEYFVRFLIGSFLVSRTDSVSIVNRRVVYNLNVSYADGSPSVVLINNQIPGPLIEAELNDILVIHVKNFLPGNERLSIHFHGMLVRQTPHMDGVPYITQMPIESQNSFTYVFRAYPAGTYFYHSHVGLQSITAFGGLIVHDRRRPWNIPELASGPLLFSESWAQTNRLIQEQNLLASPFGWMGEPMYLYINHKRDLVIDVDPGKQYLIRLIGATSLSTVVFGIDSHPMTIVEADGSLIKPRENVQSLELSSGQRYAVIIATKNETTNGIYLMKLAIRWRTLVNGSSCTGILRYSSYTGTLPADLSTLTLPTLAENHDLLSFSYNTPFETLLSMYHMPRRQADREILLQSKQVHTPDGRGMRWIMNNASLTEERVTILTRALIQDAYNGIDANYPVDATYTINQNELIDLVIQNTVATNGVCESHPFHLHGHKFWIHSQGAGEYTSTSKQTPDIDNPVYRDSLTLYATAYDHLAPNRSTVNHLKPCGWVKIRFIADNPGLWLLHCHIGAHMFMGMTVLIKEDLEHLTMSSLSQN
ncbi:unnamed protein product [Adineta ricciae]|uniref:Uncharacterized protein n=1 Tax=Adineta ricciae TaxID=249248 RepID=A0A814DY37_ADIRI|nr:unnamed protein product [Adineta ricciae]CAF1538477.1 unnamed protein product [Adineta ricciae]